MFFDFFVLELSYAPLSICAAHCDAPQRGGSGCCWCWCPNIFPKKSKLADATPKTRKRVKATVQNIVFNRMVGGLEFGWRLMWSRNQRLPRGVDHCLANKGTARLPQRPLRRSTVSNSNYGTTVFVRKTSLKFCYCNVAVC